MTTEPATPMPRLEELTLPQLNELASVIIGLQDVGNRLQDQGFDPSFSLVPGFPVTMKLDYSVPMPGPRPVLFPAPTEVKSAAEDLTLDGPTLKVSTAILKPTLMGPTEALTKAAPPKCPTAQEVDAIVTAACDKVLPSLASVKTEAKAAPDPAPAPEPAPASARPPEWTADEDARLVDMVARGIVQHGETKGTAIRSAAAVLRRPTDGAEFRLKNKLKDRLAEAIQRLQTTSDADALKAQPADPQPAAPKPAGNADWRPEAALSASTLSPIEQHLLDMPTKGGWTLEIDLHVLELAEMGWTMPEIATETGRDGRALSERFDQLTGFDRDTKTRKWKRTDLLAAAREWVSKTYPTPAAE